MLKWLRSIDWFAIGASALILAAMLLIISQQKQPISSPNQQASQIPAPMSPEERMADYALALDVFTAALVVIGALEIWLLFRTDKTARWQADILTEQKQLGRRQFFAENRPKLELRFAQRLRANSHIQVSAKRTYVEFSIMNTGTNAAHITGSRVRLDWFYPDDVPNPDAMGGTDIIPHRRLIVSARERCTLDIADTAPENSFEEGFSEEPDSRLEQAKLFLLGWVVYHDDRGSEWGDPRTTYFCRAYNPITGRFAAIPELADWEFTH